MTATPREAPRGITEIAATISNALLGALLIVASLLGLVAIMIVAVDIADQTWASLGAQIAAQLGSDIASLFATFQIDIATILTSLAEQNNLPEFGPWVRQLLGLVMMFTVALGLAGVTPIWVARSIWSRRSSSGVRLFGVLFGAIGLVGLLVTGGPHLIWGLVLANGLLTLVASRAIRPSA